MLEDDDSSGFDVPFTFAFYGTAQPRAFINSDGNITFGEGDSASTERSVSRFLAGVPRIAPFFADLDPTTGSGRVFLATGADGVTVTWCNVRGFDLTDTVTVQTTMLPTGVVEIRFGANVGLDDAVVGLSPGRTSQFTTVDLSGGCRQRRRRPPPWASASRRTPRSIWRPSRASSIRRIRTTTTSWSSGPTRAW